jgi:hypothetical protein
LEVIGELAVWSPWLPFADACHLSPRVPGVYLAREGEQGPSIYVGMAGERHGRGQQGRLAVYASGKALASGLGEAVFDRALADTSWLKQRLDEVQSGQPRRAGRMGPVGVRAYRPPHLLSDDGGQAQRDSIGANSDRHPCRARTVNRRR